MLPSFYRPAQHVGHARRAHLRLQVVRRHLLRRHQQAFFALVRRLNPAVEEIGHVRVLLRLGGAEHRLAAFGQHFGDDAGQDHRSERDGKRECGVVLRHRDEPDRGAVPHVEAVEPVERQRPHDLTHPVGAEVEAEDAIAALDPRRVRDHPRLHEFVGLTRLIRLRDRRERIGDRRADAVDHRVVGELGPVPSLVAVHRVVAPHHSGHGDAIAQLPHEPEPRLGERIASIEPRVQHHRDLLPPPQLDRREQVLVERVDAAVADETHQVQGSARRAQGGAQLHERGETEELPRRHRLRDPDDVLRHDATGAEIEVADLAVAHLALGQPDGEAGRVEQGARRALPQPVPGRRAAQLDGVAFAHRAEAPAVEHDQDDRGAPAAARCHIEGDAS